jgi:hypothetical protein
MGGERGDLFLRYTRHKRGSPKINGKFFSGETSMGMYKLKEAKERFLVISWSHTDGSVIML